MVGLLMITHGRIGSALLDSATAVLGGCPLPAEVLVVDGNSDPDDLLQLAREKVTSLNEGGGVIVLTDMYGSTSGNIAARLQCNNDQVVVIAGVNLPMLVRLLNYPGLSLSMLAEKALTGGRDGIFHCKPEDWMDHGQ